ncbi:MAG TPA: 3',5'-cyclic-nucleotide phosphodiesterase [Thermodesulfobacteriota bacterium]|jgi:cAMP phosphodiesterase
MQISVLGCNGSRDVGLNPTALLIGKNVLIDAGTCSEVLSNKVRSMIDHVFITHAHIDHIADLPFLAQTAFDFRKKPLNIYGIKETIDDISAHIFNGRIWPNFNEIPNTKQSKISLTNVIPLKNIRINSLNIMAIPVNHTVPTVGLLIDSGNSAFAFTSDTYKTELFWENIRDHKRLKALIIECSFPNRLEKTAKLTGHLTPNLLSKEVSKMHRTDIKIYVTHMKPIHREEIIKELKVLSKNLPLQILEDGMNIKI